MRSILLACTAVLILAACGKPAPAPGTITPGTDTLKTSGVKSQVEVGSWSYDQIRDTILTVFPEAYPEFFEVTFGDGGSQGPASPQRASFLVPDKYFSQFTEEVLDQRAGRIREKFGYLGCEGIHAGEPEMYSYAAWEDKKVRRFTYYFGLGC